AAEPRKGGRDRRYGTTDLNRGKFQRGMGEAVAREDHDTFIGAVASSQQVAAAPIRPGKQRAIGKCRPVTARRAAAKMGATRRIARGAAEIDGDIFLPTAKRRPAFKPPTPVIVVFNFDVRKRPV